jgi:integrase
MPPNNEYPVPKRPSLLRIIRHRSKLVSARFWRIGTAYGVDFKTAPLHVRRVKNGILSTHPLTGRELRVLRRHQRESAKSPFVFVSERGAPLSAPGFSRMIERAAAVAKLGIEAHAHMLRHAAGYKLANDGVGTQSLQAYLEHEALHRVGAGSVQGLLARLTPPCQQETAPAVCRTPRLSGSSSR